MPLQRVVERNALADEALAVIDQQPQIEFGAVQLRGRQRVQAFAQRRAGDRERVDAVGLPAPASAATRRRPSASSSRAGPARRGRSETAQRSPRRAGSPPAPRPARRRGSRAQTSSAANPWRRPGPSARPATRRSPPRPRRSCASACGCPHRARSLTSSTSTSIELDLRRTRLAGGAATLLSSHAEHPRPATSDTAKGGQAPTADSLKESQLAAGRGAFTSRRTSPTRRIETASLEGTLAVLPSALLVVVRSGSLPSLGRCDGGRCPWAVFASVGPEDRRRRPEALEGAVDAEEEFPQELRDGRDALQ